mmetsp:Transcript_13984/g.49654  ORF Transcript_13984/g.49654 Transcript_13984/m.49654 type:complete len:203 (+) Transcript_13984:1-609(+)
MFANPTCRIDTPTAKPGPLTPEALERLSALGVAVGIDLGTTNSAVAVVLDGKAKLVPPGLVPSVVCYIDSSKSDSSKTGKAGLDAEWGGNIALRDDDGDGIAVVVGHAAEAMRDGPHGASVCSRIKRVLGRDVRLDAPGVAFECTSVGDCGGAEARRSARGRRQTRFGSAFERPRFTAPHLGRRRLRGDRARFAHGRRRLFK